MGTGRCVRAKHTPFYALCWPYTPSTVNRCWLPVWIGFPRNNCYLTDRHRKLKKNEIFRTDPVLAVQLGKPSTAQATRTWASGNPPFPGCPYFQLDMYTICAKKLVIYCLQHEPSLNQFCINLEQRSSTAQMSMEFAKNSHSRIWSGLENFCSILSFLRIIWTGFDR